MNQLEKQLDTLRKIKSIITPDQLIAIVESDDSGFAADFYEQFNLKVLDLAMKGVYLTAAKEKQLLRKMASSAIAARSLKCHLLQIQMKSSEVLTQQEQHAL